MIQTKQKTLPEKLREYRQKKGWGKLAFCKAAGINFHSYTHVEPTDKRLTPRPIGLKIFKQLAEYFANDVEMTKALLDYAALDPKTLLRILAADAWILVEDEMPNRFTLVSVSCHDKDAKGEREPTWVTNGYYDSFKELWFIKLGALLPLTIVKSVGRLGEFYNVEVIAWQPLPEPLRVAGVAEVVAGEVTK